MKELIICDTLIIYLFNFFQDFLWKMSISCKCPKSQKFLHFWSNFVHSTGSTGIGWHRLCVWVNKHSKDYV